MPDICLTQCEYSFHDNKPVVNLFGRDKDGNAHRVDVIGFKPYFYIPASESPKVLPPAELDTNEYFSIRHEPLVKVFTEKPGDVRELRDKFSKSFESDILYTSRFLIDSKIKSGFSYTQSPCTINDITPLDLNYPARVCIVDIECSDEHGFPDAMKDPLFCITAYDSFAKRYTTFVIATIPLDETPKENGCFNTSCHDVLTYSDEKSLLLDFCDYIKSTDPDILTGWNFTDFDAPYILTRLDKLGIPRDNLARLHTTGDRTEIRGRQLFDLLAGYKRMHLGEQPSYRLDAIAAEELGQQKIRFTGRVCDLWKDDPTNLVYYNFTDVALCVGIDNKDETVEFHRHVAQYVGCQLERTTNSMPIVDMLVLREAKENGFVLPTKIGINNTQESFEGATVIAPLPGVNENVIVLDLKSLYPMTMMTINASPETKDPNGELRAPNGVRFKKEPDGLVRKIQAKFLRERDELKKERNKYPFDSKEYKILNMKQDVVKINMNSYYGVSGSPVFRLNDRDIGAAVTSVGRAILEHNKEIVEGEGFKIAQADTDGLAVKIPKSIGREYTMVVAKELEKLLNDSYPAFAKEKLNADVQYFSVKFEKLYERFFSGGKKKRYAGLLVWKEGVEAHKVDIVGFETKRSDSPKITRDAMKLLIESVLEGKPYTEIQIALSEIIRKYRAGGYSLDEIGIPGGIGKVLEDYETQDAQVRAAVYSNTYLGTNFGKGSKPKRLYIKNVVSKYPRTDVVAFEYADQIDRNIFIVDIDTMMEKTLKVPLTRILEPLGYQWNEFDSAEPNLKKWGF